MLKIIKENNENVNNFKTGDEIFDFIETGYDRDFDNVVYLFNRKVEKEIGSPLIEIAEDDDINEELSNNLSNLVFNAKTIFEEETEEDGGGFYCTFSILDTELGKIATADFPNSEPCYCYYMNEETFNKVKERFLKENKTDLKENKTDMDFYDPNDKDLPVKEKIRRLNNEIKYAEEHIKFYEDIIKELKSGKREEGIYDIDYCKEEIANLMSWKRKSTRILKRIQEQK